jgi:4-amino-4-deoxy-L-arabinose transferase-like glycosyltransferase
LGAISYSQPYTNQERESWLTKPFAWRVTPALVMLGAVILLSIGFHFYKIQTIGTANTYYTAAVKSMLQSWHNFFFVSAEPGGSVTVDKPPLGFWIETAFAAVLGVSGFSVSLPNILAGIFSIPLLYHLVKKYFGTGAGLAAALALAVTPVTLAVDRNNTIDGMLIFTLLLAAWAFIKAVDTSRLRYLLLGALWVGLGFNIKMLEAFLPLPAFYTFYFLSAKQSWLRKTLYLGLATLLLVVVSFSWAVAVDLTPTRQRPFIGSTSSNSEMELIFGYNGANRLFGRMGFGGNRPFFGQPSQPGNNRQGLNPGGNPPDGQNGTGQGFNPPQGFRGGGGPGGFDIGQAGPLRLFQAPLGKEVGWLLPFGLIAIVLALVSSRVRLPLESNEHKGLVLWGSWLITCLVFFSIAGFFHNYYLATISPALGAVVGMGFSIFNTLRQKRIRFIGLLLLVSGLLTVVFQIYLAAQFDMSQVWELLGLGLLAVGAVILLVSWISKHQILHFPWMATSLVLTAMLIIPAVWSGLTVAQGAGGMLPEAYTGTMRGEFGRGFGSFGPGGGTPGNTGNQSNATLSYLEANTQDVRYLLAVTSANEGAPLVLETGRPVLYMGGFTGSDPVVSASSLAQLVSNGELRYIEYGGGGFRGANSEVGSWIQSNCTPVTAVSSSLSGFGRGGGSLYQCGK